MRSLVRTRTLAAITAAALALGTAAPLAHACAQRTLLKVSGAPATCDESFTLTASVLGRASVASVAVSLDGRKVAAEPDRSLSAQIDCAGLREGKHELVVRARTTAGKTLTRRVGFAVRR